VDLQAWEEALRQVVLCAGATILTELLSTIGCGRRREPVVCSCGHRMTSRGVRTKTLRTILGPIRFARSLFRCPSCSHKCFPADALLNVEDTGFSPGLRRFMARAGSRSSFADAEEDLRVYAGVSVDRRDIQRVAEQVGQQVEGWMVRENRSYKPVRGDIADIPILYISLDGTGIPVRKSEVEGRRGKAKDGKAKTREVKLGCVFTQTKVDDRGYPVRDDGSTSYVGAIEQSKLFGQRLRFEAVRRGYRDARQVVAISDGAAYNKTIIHEQFPRATHIIDLYHAREHLYILMKALAVESDEYGKWLKALDRGHIKTIIARAHSLPCPEAAAETLRIETQYFAKNANAMRYQTFRKCGYFVGSGVIEAGCRTVVGQRMKRSGMFWSVAGANAILALRCCEFSGRFDDFWESLAN